MEELHSHGPHEHTLAGTFWNHVPNAQPVHVIAGAYRRGVEVAPSKLMADTSTRAVTVQTPHLFIDLRIAASRPQTCARPLDELTNPELVSIIVSTHCFGGVTLREPTRPPPLDGTSVFDNVPPGHTCVCTRWHLLDWQPFPRLTPNRWSVQELWSSGGWAEWSVRRDPAGQAAYIEHWMELRGSRSGTYVALRRLTASSASSSSSSEALLLVAGDSFAYLAGRPTEHALPVVTPGSEGHPADRGRIEPLALAALARGDRAALLSMLSMECHFGSVAAHSAMATCPEAQLLRSSGASTPATADGSIHTRWCIHLSSWPWMEGTSLEDWVRGFRWQPRGTTGAGLTLVHAPSGDEWQVVHCEGDLSGVADLLRAEGSRL